MSQLTVVATIIAKPGAEQQVETALRALIDPTRQEAGCIQYDLHQSIEQPTVFLFFENWQSRAALDAHMQSAHLIAYLSNTEGLLESWDVKLMNRLA